MAKSGDWEAYRINGEIMRRIKIKKTQERVHGSVTAYIEGILDRYAADVQASQHATKTVNATRVRKISSGEQRKIA